VAVSIFVRSEAPRSGPQPFDPGRHMRQVAQLVSSVFADELDDRGRNALREMEFAGRLSPFLGGLTSLALFSDELYGYVWTEDGRVVGNVSLQQGDDSGLRWRISNVSVLPAYRGRGIARTLMQETLRDIARRAGAWAILQVRAGNEQAHRLYLELGFADICRVGIWRLPTPTGSPPASDPAIPLEPLRTLTGSDWLDLARAARPQLAQWVAPLNPADYQIGLGRLAGEALGRWTGAFRVERWAYWEHGRLMGAVETRSDVFESTDFLRFAVRPDARGRVESTLLARGLRSLARRGLRPVLVEHGGDHAEGVLALEAAGFKVERDLVTMRRQMRPDDKR
jgi:ribosomal protein S18 acetylase RimI-like enzyme